MALAVNYGLYNEVATEALFSAQANVAIASLYACKRLAVPVKAHFLALHALLYRSACLPAWLRLAFVQGAAQLDADLAAMAAIFGAYTGRPAAHFKESKEAVRLLMVPHDAAMQLLSALEAQPRAAKQLLAPHGVKQLNAEQAAVVLLQRLDVLTRRAGRGTVQL